jgi:hypothetical protein
VSCELRAASYKLRVWEDVDTWSGEGPRKDRVKMVVEFRMGDVVRLKKAHPCGSLEWEVVRLGADIGLKCSICRHQIMLERATLERRVKCFVKRGAAE